MCGKPEESITKNEDLSVMRGKLDIYGTIKNQIQRKKSLSCEYDELSVNNIFNQILKTTMTILIRDSGVKKSHKADLKKIILFFHDIDIIEPSRIRWSRVSGMLLYAKTEEAITPDCSFVIGGNKISVKTVDLNKEFKLIAAQLDKIAEDYFGKKRIEDSII